MTVLVSKFNTKFNNSESLGRLDSISKTFVVAASTSNALVGISKSSAGSTSKDPSYVVISASKKSKLSDKLCPYKILSRLESKSAGNNLLSRIICDVGRYVVISGLLVADQEKTEGVCVFDIVV